MKFQVSSEIDYEVRFPSTLILNIHALRTPAQTVLEETFTVEPYVRIEEFTSVNGENRFARMEVTEPMTLRIAYRATVDTHPKTIDLDQNLENVPVVQLDGSVIPFLFPSRYCQSDKLYRMAYNQFGKIEGTPSRVLAIADWIYENVEYLSGSTNSQTSAYDTIAERAGVCRDFAHLGVTLCRALTIPARYFTGYAYQLTPPDFHACFEAFIGGQWILFDATRLAPLNGLVKIATGRDAADAAVASIFGNVVCTAMKVDCQVVDPDFVPFAYDRANLKGMSYQ
ncbi:MAG: transglutaminase family protein [Ferruginibacter sp.]|nr:transglutaminase family protein [Cytophagales bacterium]